MSHQKHAFWGKRKWRGAMWFPETLLTSYITALTGKQTTGIHQAHNGRIQWTGSKCFLRWLFQSPSSTLRWVNCQTQIWFQRCPKSPVLSVSIRFMDLLSEDPDVKKVCCLSGANEKDNADVSLHIKSVFLTRKGVSGITDDEKVWRLWASHIYTLCPTRWNILCIHDLHVPYMVQLKRETIVYFAGPVRRGQGVYSKHGWKEERSSCIYWQNPHAGTRHRDVNAIKHHFLQ